MIKLVYQNLHSIFCPLISNYSYYFDYLLLIPKIGVITIAFLGSKILQKMTAIVINFNLKRIIQK